MDITLSAVKREFAPFCLDDIVIFSKYPNEHIYCIQEVWTLLNERRAKCEAEKSKVFTNWIDYFPHVMDLECLAFNSNKTDGTCSLQTPFNIMGLRFFLVLCSVIDQFVLNFAWIVDHPNRKMQNELPFVYTLLSHDELEALKPLIVKPISPLLLSLLGSLGTYKVYTDACARHIGCVLLQKQCYRHKKSIRDWSYLLVDAERAFGTPQRRLLEHETREAKSSFFQPVATTVGIHGLCCSLDYHITLVATSSLDGALQTVVPKSL